MIFYDLLYDGKSDTAAALGGVAGSICTEKAFKDIAQVFGGNAFSVILDLHPDGIDLIQNTDIDHAFFLIHIFDAVADDIADNTF